MILRLAALLALALVAACSVTSPAGISREPGFSANCAEHPGVGVCP